MCRVGGSGTPIVVMSQQEVNCVCYRVVTRGVLPALLIRFSGAAGLIRGFLVRQHLMGNRQCVRGCSPRRRVHRYLNQRILRFGEQARAHKGELILSFGEAFQADERARGQ